MRIVRVANYVAPRSGGLKTALRNLGAGYQAAGHESVLVIPGEKATDEQTEQGRVITLPGAYVPGLGGYRVLLDRRRLAATLRSLRPDRLEISDRTTLRWLGRWARRRDIPTMMVSHESLDGLLRLFGPASGRRVADVLNGRTAADHDRIVCTTRWASREFARIGAPVDLVPLGVDLDRFTPDRRDPAMRSRWAGPDDVLLLHCGRLSPEKKPRRSLAALEGLRHQGVRAVLVVAGAGPLRHALQEEAASRGLPVRFLGHLTDPLEVAALQASADVAIAPGPIETFGLSALETLASGTPVVVSAQSALPEVIGAAGLAAAGDGPGYVTAVLDLLSRPEDARRQAARAQAEKFPWSASVAGFLAAHQMSGGDPVRLAEPLGRDTGRPQIVGDLG
ncbi:alpha-1,6-mannosyltransferase [Actinoplanes tereljensis]|uniref:GDP-mannose-dependent alpha-(1-6)-phosphatidylinositol dimannoside mannosyltransferase n=1 Tax=Paractinoplanes tereljensis TaxID=571912 RepID=A0A919NZW2_9ACTN|nr:glycosyltransferase [Actinoplanes tereljensis]GIF26996.1 GDP-mannose-dependent alpha-(1-6)-phosphatidylinositol dimannoside mannosyltransferase [Actinoplanes tereljensis]